MTHQKVFRLEVTVDDPGRVMQVVDRLYHLREIKARITFGEASCVVLLFDEGEEVALFDQLEDDEKNLNRTSSGTNHELAMDVPIQEVNDVGVLDVLEEAHFVVENSLEGWQGEPLNMVPLNNLHRAILARHLVLRELHSVSKQFSVS